MDAVFEQPGETDKYWMDDKQRTTEVLQVDKAWIEARQGDQHTEKHVERQRFENRTFAEPRTTDRQTDRYWTESRSQDRHAERQWTVDRHTQRQIDRKIERQWMGGRQIDRSWSEHRPADMQVDNQWTESRHASRKGDRQVQALHLAQRPLPPYPSDRTPSPKQEADPLKSTEAAAADWHQQDAQGDRQMCPDAGGGFTEGWRSSGGGGGGGGRSASCSSKPDPPPQSSKPNLSKLRPRHRLESADTLPGTSLSLYVRQLGKRDEEILAFAKRFQVRSSSHQRVNKQQSEWTGISFCFFVRRDRGGRRNRKGSWEEREKERL